MFIFIFTSELVSLCGYIQYSPQASFGEWDLPSPRGFVVNPRKGCLERELSSSLHVWKDPALAIPLSNSATKQAHIIFEAIEIPAAPRVSSNSHHLAPNNGIYWCFLFLRIISKQVLWANILFLCCPLKESSEASNPSQATGQSWEMVYSCNIFSLCASNKEKSKLKKMLFYLPTTSYEFFCHFQNGLIWFPWNIATHIQKLLPSWEVFISSFIPSAVPLFFASSGKVTNPWKQEGL